MVNENTQCWQNLKRSSSVITAEKIVGKIMNPNIAITKLSLSLL